MPLSYSTKRTATDAQDFSCTAISYNMEMFIILASLCCSNTGWFFQTPTLNFASHLHLAALLDKLFFDIMLGCKMRNYNSDINDSINNCKVIYLIIIASSSASRHAPLNLIRQFIDQQLIDFHQQWNWSPTVRRYQRPQYDLNACQLVYTKFFSEFIHFYVSLAYYTPTDEKANKKRKIEP